MNVGYSEMAYATHICMSSRCVGPVDVVVAVIICCVLKIYKCWQNKWFGSEVEEASECKNA